MVRACSPRSSSVALAAYSLYWVLFIVQPQVYRVSFLLLALVLTFLLYPGSTRSRTTRPTTGRLAADRGGGRRAGVADCGLRAVRPPRRRAGRDRSGARHHDDRHRAGSDPAHGRADPAGDGDRVPRVCLAGAGLRSHRAVAHRAPRLRPGSSRRHPLHDARGDVRRAARRGRDLHHPVHHLRGRARAERRRRVLHPTGRWRSAAAPWRRAGPLGDDRRVPARDGLRQRRRDHGHARLGRVAAAAPCRYMRRKPPARCSPPPASARCCRRRRLAPRRS